MIRHKNTGSGGKAIIKIILMSLFCLSFFPSVGLFSQQTDDLEFFLDVNSNTVPMPNILKPDIDLSGRGYHYSNDWPQVLSSEHALEIWNKDMDFTGMYRIQYNLWEIEQLSKDQTRREELLENYEDLIKKVNDAGGIIILDIFSTPAGLGKVLDKKSAPIDFKKFKELIKAHIRRLSCEKKFNVWYEVWSAPDMDDFFLGRKQEYLSLYRATAEAIMELEQEFKIYIPLGGPSTSWWFQNVGGNTILNPEKSLIYDLINFCYRYHLPLDFISWHSYSSDAKVDKEITIYNKTAVNLIRDWLKYFNFDSNMPLIIDEWNYDRDANLLPERGEKSNICASFIVSRLKSMYEQGLDYQLYFSLEDFQNNKEGVTRNTGIFWFDSKNYSENRGGPKASYNAFRMLKSMDGRFFNTPSKFDDDFIGVISSGGQEQVTLLIYNYIDPEILRDYLSRNISTLNGNERKMLLNLIKTDKLSKIASGQLDIQKLHLPNKLKTLVNKAISLNALAEKYLKTNRNLKISLKNLKGNYHYQRFTVDSSCWKNCEFTPLEEKEISIEDLYSEVLPISPYSLNMIILKKKEQPVEPEAAVSAPVSAGQEVSNTTAIKEDTATQPK